MNELVVAKIDGKSVNYGGVCITESLRSMSNAFAAFPTIPFVEKIATIYILQFLYMFTA